MFLRRLSAFVPFVSDAALSSPAKGFCSRVPRVSAELGISDDVYFVGRCQRVGELLGISDYASQSQAEGFSNSILEYMAAADLWWYRRGGAREAVVDGRDGLYRASGDLTMKDGSAHNLATDEPDHARRMGELGRRVVEESFRARPSLRATERCTRPAHRTCATPRALAIQGERA